MAASRMSNRAGIREGLRGAGAPERWPLRIQWCWCYWCCWCCWKKGWLTTWCEGGVSMGGLGII